MWVVLLKWKLEWDRNKNHVAVKLGVFIFIYFLLLWYGGCPFQTREVQVKCCLFLSCWMMAVPFYLSAHIHYIKTTTTISTTTICYFCSLAILIWPQVLTIKGEEMCDGQLKINYLLACLLSCLSVAWVTLETSEFVTYIVDIIFKLHAHL